MKWHDDFMSAGFSRGRISAPVGSHSFWPWTCARRSESTAWSMTRTASKTDMQSITWQWALKKLHLFPEWNRTAELIQWCSAVGFFKHCGRCPPCHNTDVHANIFASKFFSSYHFRPGCVAICFSIHWSPKKMSEHDSGIICCMIALNSVPFSDQVFILYSVH